MRLFCSASAPAAAGRLHFEWRKNQNELLSAAAETSGSRRAPGDGDLAQEVASSQDAPGSSNEDAETREAGSGASATTTSGKGRRVRISMMDESASLLRITQLEADDSGNYTCLVRNQHGFDSSTVRVSVMGE